MQIKAVLFDKDGTILDFHQTWDRAFGSALRAAASSDQKLIAAASAVEFDLETETIRPGSPLIAESNETIAALLEPHVDIETLFSTVASTSWRHLAAAEGLPDLFQSLAAAGVKMAVVTNDYESVAAEQMDALGWSQYFDQIVGSDSGLGAKPQPGMVSGTLERLGVEPEQAIMVGDTTHDLLAGANAGAATVLTTNGATAPAFVSDHATVVVSSLAELVPALERAGLSVG